MDNARERGFTLLETLVAFSILSVALGIFYSTFSTSLNRQDQAGLEARALQLAENNLVQAGTVWPLELATLNGQEDQFAWVVTMRPRPDEASSIWIYEVTSEVTWGTGPDQGRVFLETLKLGPEDDIDD